MISVKNSLTGLKKINPLYQQMACHLLYIVLAFEIHAQERPVFLILSMWAFILAAEFVFIRRFKTQGWAYPVASLVICNSIYLNMEAYGTLYWPFFLATAVALVAKYFLRVAGRPVFNPSLIGVLFISTILPQTGSAAMYAWNGDWKYVAIVFCLGAYMTHLSKTIALSFSYIISFMAFSFICSYFAHLIPQIGFFIIPQEVPALLYPLSIFCFGNILFAFHGIGDPSTAPQTRRGQITFGVCMGILDFILRIGVVLVAPFLAYAIMLLVFGFLRLHKTEPVWTRQIRA